MIRRIHFIEYNAKVDTLGAGTILPKYGTPLLAAVLKERGYDVRIFMEGVSDMDFGRMTDCDLVCFPVYFPIVNKVRGCAEQIRRLRPGLPIVAGGPQAAMFPESVVGLCDYAVRCEGDEVLPELVERLSRGADARLLAGISYRSEGRVVHNPQPAPPPIPTTMPDLTLIDGFDRALRWGRRHRVANLLQTSRGCAFRCRFCPTSKLFGGVYRNRDIDSIVAEIRAKLAYNRLFLVVDNSFLSNRKRTLELLQRLADERLGAHLIVFERHEIGNDAEILDLMWKAGVRCIIVGIESLVDENLRLYNKHQTSSQVRRSVQNILDHNIEVLATFVLGGDEDTRQRSREVIDFVHETGVIPNLFILHDLENEDSPERLIPLGRRFMNYYERTAPGDTSYYDYMTGNFATYFPKRMKPSTLQRCVGEVFQELFSHRDIARRVFSSNLFNSIFGVAHGYSMRQLSRSVLEPANGYYTEYLKEIEAGLYDADELLQEDRLAGLQSLPLPPPLRQRPDYPTYRGLMALMVAPGLVRYGLKRLQVRWHGARG